MPSRQNRPQPAVLAIAVAVLLLAAGASAQPPSEKTRIVSVNLGMQFINDAFMNRVTFLQDDETGVFESHYDVTKHHSLDGGIAVRLWRGFALGFAVSHVAEPTTAQVDAEGSPSAPLRVPAPGQRRTKRPETERDRPARSGGGTGGSSTRPSCWRATWGPTIFIARQDLVSQIGTREVGTDFDRVALTSHRSRTVTAGSLGLNLGFDGTWFLTERLGFGFSVRYSRGTATVRLGNRSPTPLELGGTHAGGGLRLAF